MKSFLKVCLVVLCVLLVMQMYTCMSKVMDRRAQQKKTCMIEGKHAPEFHTQVYCNCMERSGFVSKPPNQSTKAARKAKRYVAAGLKISSCRYHVGHQKWYNTEWDKR